MSRFRNSGLTRFRNSRLPRFRNSTVSRFRNSGVSPIQKLQVAPIQKLQVAPIQKLQVAPIQKPLHAISVLNANLSLSKSSCHDCTSFLKLNHHFQKFPPQSPTCNGIPQCTSLPLIEFLSRWQVISKLPPQNPTHAIVALNANPFLS